MRFIQNKTYRKFLVWGNILITLLIMTLFLKKLIIYLLACALIGCLVYIRALARIPFKIEPYLFVGIIISLGYGIWLTIIFMIIAMLIPKMMGGGEFDGSTWVYLFLFLMMNIVATAFSSMNIVALGTALSVIDFIIIIILGATMRPDKVINGMVIVGINIFLFYRFGETILALINPV